MTVKAEIVTIESANVRTYDLYSIHGSTYTESGLADRPRRRCQAC